MIQFHFSVCQIFLSFSILLESLSLPGFTGSSNHLTINLMTPCTTEGHNVQLYSLKKFHGPHQKILTHGKIWHSTIFLVFVASLNFTIVPPSITPGSKPIWKLCACTPEEWLHPKNTLCTYVISALHIGQRKHSFEQLSQQIM